MPSDFDWLEFVTAVLVMELTPGPNMAWLAGLSLANGRRAGLMATAGIALGLSANALLAAVGLATLLAAAPRMQSVLHWVGVGFMVWLAWRTWVEGESDTPAAVRAGRDFLAGFLVNLFNPKALIFYVAIIPPFLRGRQARLDEALRLAAVSVTIATAVHLAIVLGAGRAHDLASNPARSRITRRAIALVMLAIAGWLALGTG
ncbi:MAG: LysE family translocator [Sphingomonadales bacterium]|nr:LysE family translocator [Sphingomonadales bacterium]